MKVLVVGAGLTGCRVVRALKAAAPGAVSVSVWEKARGVGGRASCQRLSASEGAPPAAVVDLGAQYVTKAAGVADAGLHAALLRGGLLEAVKPSSVVGAPDPEHDFQEHLVAPAGMNSLCKWLSGDMEGVEVGFGRHLSALDKPDTPGPGVVAVDQHGLGEVFDVVVLTTPVPQMTQLLDARPFTAEVLDAESSALRSKLDSVSYSSRFAAAVLLPDSPAVREGVSSIGGVAAYTSTSDGAVRYVSVESLKRPGAAKAAGADGAGVGLLLHSSVPFGLRYGDLKPADRTATVLPRMLEGLGEAFPGLAPSVVGPPLSQRLLFWRYSQVYKTPWDVPGSGSDAAPAAHAVRLPGTPGLLVLAGDAFAGRSGFDFCMRSGVDAADAVLAHARAATGK